jgi:hypothetical protein
MIVFDLIGAIGLTASAAIVIAVLGCWYAGSRDGNVTILVWHVVWFVLIVSLGATGALSYPAGFGPLGLGAVVVLPLAIVGILAMRPTGFRAAFVSIPLPTLIGVNAVRILGFFFVLLYMNGRLPAPFAPTAGWGDIIIGASALPVAWAVSRRRPGWRAMAWLWNSLGLLDLIAAIVLGIASAEGSPLRVFYGEPGTAIMSGLPWLLIPAFLVPNLILMHLAVFQRISTAPGSTKGV